MPFAESLDAMIAPKKEGKIRHLALSNVGPAELEFALARTPVGTSRPEHLEENRASRSIHLTFDEVQAIAAPAREARET